MTKFLGADGVTHLYSKIKSWVTSNFLSKSGGTVTGDLTVSKNIHTDNDLTVDGSASIEGTLTVNDSASFDGTVTAPTFSGNATSATKATSATSATSSSYITSYGTHTETASGTTGNSPTTGMATTTAGLFMSETFNDSNTPAMYGNIVNVIGKNYVGTGQLLLEWSGTDSTTGRLYYRSHRDLSSGGWGSWNTVAYISDIPKNANEIEYGSTSTLTYKNGNTEQINSDSTVMEILEYIIDALNQLV